MKAFSFPIPDKAPHDKVNNLTSNSNVAISDRNSQITKYIKIKDNVYKFISHSK